MPIIYYFNVFSSVLFLILSLPIGQLEIITIMSWYQYFFPSMIFVFEFE